MVQKTAQIKNLELATKFKKKIGKSIDLDRFILFGSRAGSGFRQDSDFDLLIISKDFEKIPWYKRAGRFYLMWDEDYPLEILCYTPEEIERRKGKVGIISEAMQKGVEI
ncbi:nucleotidyltransferase domain-containing protein [Candidatus Woesearchaeota archaeon]|nr:nucleotidyltransferase domain-containing protein [Candidatus Woesearchaeota archaeon]